MSKNEELERSIEAIIFRLLTLRGLSKTICPSEVARTLEPEDWKPLMGSIHQVVKRLVQNKSICITYRNKCLTIDDLRGPYRISFLSG